MSDPVHAIMLTCDGCGAKASWRVIYENGDMAADGVFCKRCADEEVRAFNRVEVTE